MTESLPPTTVIRISRGDFDPARFEEVDRMTKEISTYLIPAIQKLPGLLSYYAGASPDGSAVHVSIWDNEEHAQQMNRLKEMIVDAKRDAEAAGVTLIPIIHYPLSWSI
jgi:quinol monooxygenase YgiN